MRKLLLAAVAVAAFAVHAAPSEAACIATLNWRTYTYTGAASNPAGVKIGAELPERAKVPSCNDMVVNGQVPPLTYSDMPVAQLDGVPPSVALAGGASVVYVNASTFPQLPSHPLHRTLGYDRAPERPVSGAPCQVKGVARTDTAGLTVNGARVIVTRDTKVELQRHGTGFIAPGTTVRVGGSACEKKYGAIWVKARRIARVTG
ncbi:hypothetical protein DVA67_029690 [Solirubrobacter sp. CPCC 204708]|uniref:Uncharacterized protein n=1 Tax=Solirubrobacter deserti TaxID=2282478 RepID=A0ABT4RUG4_9ACTN|nr:hypothetical protein [Solirubrobacter deserti]MBE2320176.1 hypothetical protein [Solirubrobacter deserti]MDA0142223.1 hypothetical protein [Solirubrobacter deserti]